MGPPRHLSLLPALAGKVIEWPVPFSDGLSMLRQHKGRKVAVLASGDPFWFGAGSVIAREFQREEWQAFPLPSTFSLAASRLGWALEQTVCLGLHAAPLTRLRPYLAPTARCLVLLREGAAVYDLMQYLQDLGFGDSKVTVLEALGGPREKQTILTAKDTASGAFAHPVCVAVDVQGTGPALPSSLGLPDDLFETDGVMTKRPIRAITLSTLAPRAGELLWDIGGGSGSVAIEWLLSHPRCAAITIEPREDRVALINANAQAFGVDRLKVVAGAAPKALEDLPKPDAVFIGGGLSEEMLSVLERLLDPGTRVVANAVTLEADALLSELQGRKGGEMLRIEIAQAHPLGQKTGWKSSYPVVQWSGEL